MLTETIALPGEASIVLAAKYSRAICICLSLFLKKKAEPQIQRCGLCTCGFVYKILLGRETCVFMPWAPQAIV